MTSVEQQNICSMFDRIAGTYDLLNRFLSFGQDQRWRNFVANLLPRRPKLKILDVATGTGDLLLAMCKTRPEISEAHGVDLASKMLDQGKNKSARNSHLSKINFTQADACNLPYENNYFDFVTIAFGIRNVTDITQGLRELARVVKPDGQVFILEFSLPTNILIKKLYLFYFRYVLPTVGGFLSRDKQAYGYLNSTVESFLSPEKFKQLMLANGFASVTTHTLTFGVATVYCAGK